ncbi:MAG: hypothetical protein WC884_02950 [Candidatus Paceibacterota bacterium]
MEPEKKSNGALVGLAVIIIILIIGGIYIWMSNKNAVENQGIPTQSQTVTSQDAAALDALEQDIGTTNTSTGVDTNNIN